MEKEIKKDWKRATCGECALRCGETHSRDKMLIRCTLTPLKSFVYEDDDACSRFKYKFNEPTKCLSTMYEGFHGFKSLIETVSKGHILCHKIGLITQIYEWLPDMEYEETIKYRKELSDMFESKYVKISSTLYLLGCEKNESYYDDLKIKKGEFSMFADNFSFHHENIRAFENKGYLFIWTIKFLV